MSSPAKRWRAPVTGAVAGLLVAGAIVGQSALASGGSAVPPRHAARAAAAPGVDCGAQAGVKAPNGSPPDPGPAPFLAAVAQLVHAGTINQAQADVLDAGIRAGSIDDAQLVANGTLSSEQMHAVDNRLIAVKQSLAPMHTDNAPSRPAGKAAMASGTASAAGTGCGAPAGDKGASSSSADPGPGPFLAAVAHLVQAGTINQAQADVLDAGIRAGSIDDAQLVANGTLSSAQMQAVDARLRSVKESLASRAGSSQVDKAAVRKSSQH